MNNLRFRGAFTALVTPMDDSGAVDFAVMEAFFDWQITEGIHGLVPTGTTGESAVLSHEEHREVVKCCVDVASGRVPVLAGTGSNNTQEAIELSVDANAMGADALLVVSPYYNKPSPEGMYAHFKAIADEVSIPIFIYDIPGRSVVEVGSALVAKLIADCPNIVGIKDATGNLVRPMELGQLSNGSAIQFSGEDPTELAFLAQGGHGIISVSSNVAPRLHAELHEAWWSGDYALAAQKRDALFPLAQSCFHKTSSSPAPTKYGLSRLNKMGDHLRLPSIPARAEACAAMDAAMRHAGIIA